MLALAVLLVGCAGHRAGPPDREGSTSRATQPARVASPNLAGFSADFKAGYADGCASAGATLKRDQSRFDAEGSYARGWRDGFSSCKR